MNSNLDKNSVADSSVFVECVFDWFTLKFPCHNKNIAIKKKVLYQHDM